MKKNNKLVTILLASSLLLPGIAPLATGVTSVAAATETVAQDRNVDSSYVAVVDQVLRIARSDQATSRGFVPRGKRVTNVRDAGKGWFEVDYDGNTGYIQRSEVTSIENYENSGQGEIHAVDTKVDEKLDDKYIVAVATGLRTKDVDVYRPLRVLDEGEEVEYLGTTANNWFKVKDTKGVIGYINRADVTSVKNYNDDSTPVLHNVKTRIESGLKGETLRAQLTTSLRTKDNSAYRVIAALKRDDLVTYLGTTEDNWFKVRTQDGVEGFVYRGDVTKHEVDAEEPEEEKVTVDSVHALNAGHIEVQFSEKVDRASALNPKNYVFTKNNEKYGEDYDKSFASVIEEGFMMVDERTVIFELKEKDALNHGDKYGLDVKNAVKAKSSDVRVEAYGDTQKEFTDEKAPVIQSTEYNSADEVVEIYYDEPVSMADEDFGITIDGKKMQDKTTYETVLAYAREDDTLVSEIKYRVSVDVSAEKDLKKAGSHDVTIYNMRDRVKSTAHAGNKVQLATTEYEVLEIEQDDLVVVNISEKDFNSLNIKFNRVPEKAHVVVYQGSTKFYDQKLENLSSRDLGIDLPYTVKSEEDGLTTLYGKDETSTDVRVVIENYEDSNAVVGEKEEQTITLYREDAKPAAQKSSVTASYELDGKGMLKDQATITVPVLDYKADTDKKVQFAEGKGKENIKVVDKDNVSRTVASANINNNNLVVTLEKADGTKQKFEDLFNMELIIEEGTLEVGSDLIDVGSPKAKGDWIVGEATNTLRNTEETVIVEKIVSESDSNFKYVEGVNDVKVSGDNNNVITVTYKDSMTASAAQLSNYMLSGKALPNGTSISMDSTGKVVTITLPKGSVAKNKSARLQITQDVRTLDNEIIVGTLTDKEMFMSDDLDLVDNVAPVLKSGQFQVNKADDKTAEVLELSLSEDLKNARISTLKDNLEVKANGTKLVEVAKVELDEKDSDKVIITLAERISTAQKATVEVVETKDKTIKVTDLADNKLAKGSIVTIDAKDVVVGDKAPVDPETPETPVDRSALETAISSAKELDSSVYTTESWEAFNTVLAESETVLANQDATQDEIDQALTALSNAKEALEEVKSDVLEIVGEFEPGITSNVVTFLMPEGKTEIEKIEVDGVETTSYAIKNDGNVRVIHSGPSENVKFKSVVVWIDGIEYEINYEI